MKNNNQNQNNMKKVKLGLLCLLAGVVLTACKEKEPKVVTPSDYVESGGSMALGLSMVAVEGGTFDMGATAEQGSDAESDEKPVHKVTLSSYYISKYEITQAQWKAVMERTMEEQKDRHDQSGRMSLFGEGDNYPIYYVTWEEANEFCEILSAKTGKKYVLPTEAQWEFAARGGTKSKGYKYSGSNTAGDVAWFGSSYTQDEAGEWIEIPGSGNAEAKTHPVGSKAANELGICDMSGNVWEWCADWLDAYSSAALTNPVGPNAGTYRVIRGSSWTYGSTDSRVSRRLGSEPGDAAGDMGFRVVCLP